MVHIHNLFNELPVLDNMINAISSITMRARKLDEFGIYQDLPETDRLSLMLNHNDDEFSQSILGTCLRRYITYPDICIYKVKTREAALLFFDSPEMDSFDYKDNMVAGLYIIQDDEAFMDKKGNYHIYDDYTVGRRVLKRSEFIHINELSTDVSIAKRLERVLYRSDQSTTIGEILSVDDRLLEEERFGPKLDQPLRKRLIQNAFENRIIPLASFFRDAIERDLGLPEDIKITINANLANNWENAWDSNRDIIKKRK